MKLAPIHGKEIEPRILPPEITVPGHHRAEGAEGKAISAKASGDELLAGALTDEGQTVVGFHDLPQPAMLHGRLGQHLFQPRFEARKDFVGILFLARFAIFAPKDGVVVIGMPIDTEIVVGIAGVTKERFGNRPPREFRAEHITGVEGQLALKKSGAKKAGLTHQRRMGGNHEILAANLVRTGMHDERIGFDFTRFGVFKNMAALAGNRLQ